ncbi:MAG: methyl-accepting chemotaxis protein [Pseudomonadota bacterium]
METAVSQLQTLLPELQNPLLRDLANQAMAEINNFQDEKVELAAALAELVSARQIMDSLGPKIVIDIETVIDAAADRQNTLGPRGQTISLLTVSAILAAALIIITTAWRISRSMSTRVTRQLEESVSTMVRIAEGDLDAEVRHADQDTEIGRMARALEIFKVNGKASIEAVEREKAAEVERQRAAEDMKRLQEEKDQQARAKAERVRQEMISNLSFSLGKVVSAASEGDFTVRVDADFSDRELAKLASDVNSLVDSVEQGLTIVGHALERVAQGDLSQQVTGQFQGAFAQLQTNTNGMINSLRSLVGDISESSDNLAHSSGELKDTSGSLSIQAEQNAASLEETSAALEELTASITMVSKNVMDANGNARTARTTAMAGSEIASAAAKAMARISDASTEISKVLGVINDISFQINLLALNAGVEAARAGDAGRGFSVVASEVRQLAQRASAAAKEIDDVIERSNSAVSEGVTKVSDAQTSLTRISDSVVSVSERIDQISSAIAEQVQGVGEINSAVALIDRNTQKQAASFEEVTAASGLLSNEADTLKNSTKRFRIGSEGDQERLSA